MRRNSGFPSCNFWISFFVVWYFGRPTMLIIFSLLTLTRAERVDGGMHSRICLKFSAKNHPQYYIPLTWRFVVMTGISLGFLLFFFISTVIFFISTRKLKWMRRIESKSKLDNMQLLKFTLVLAGKSKFRVQNWTMNSVLFVVKNLHLLE